MPTMTASKCIRFAVVAALVSTTWLAYSVAPPSSLAAEAVNTDRNAASAHLPPAARVS